MYRRLWSGLPKDPIYPSNLKDLGCVKLGRVPYQASVSTPWLNQWQVLR